MDKFIIRINKLFYTQGFIKISPLKFYKSNYVIFNEIRSHEKHLREKSYSLEAFKVLIDKNSKNNIINILNIKFFFYFNIFIFIINSVKISS